MISDRLKRVFESADADIETWPDWMKRELIYDGNKMEGNMGIKFEAWVIVGSEDNKPNIPSLERLDIFSSAGMAKHECGESGKVAPVTILDSSTYARQQEVMEQMAKALAVTRPCISFEDVKENLEAVDQALRAYRELSK